MSSPPPLGGRNDRLRPIWHALLWAVLLLQSIGHAAQPQTAAPSPTDIGEYLPSEDPDGLLRLDDEMRAFFAARVNRKHAFDDQINEIVAAILRKQGLGFTYEADGLYDVREAFRRRRGNCVTFAMLFVAVAREYRIMMGFNEIRRDPRWNRSGGLTLETRHINAVIWYFGRSYQIDLNALTSFRIESPDFAAQRVRDYQDIGYPVDEKYVFACFYSNVGVFQSARGNRDVALRYLELATRIDPKYAPGWVNRGGAHQAAKEWEQARRCYERALQHERRMMAARCGLAVVYRQIGRVDQAENLERATARYQMNNPIFLVEAASEALARGDPHRARKYLCRALIIGGDSSPPLELLVRTARALGREREARDWARRLDRCKQPPRASD